MIIAIDGPAGAGKSTIAKTLSNKLGFIYVDTGAMYRAITWNAIQKNIDLCNFKKIIKIAKETEIELRPKKKNNILQVIVDGKDAAKEIRTEQVNQNVSGVASIQGVRKILVQKQRTMAKKENIVMEGRDIGTVVFPKADFKFYLDASPLERAKRRYKEFVEDGEKVNLSVIAKTIQRRDRLDQTRKNSPLKKAKDAIVIDSTGLNVTEVVKKMLEVLHDRASARKWLNNVVVTKHQ